MYRQIHFFVVLYGLLNIYFLYLYSKGGDFISHLVNLFFISFIINLFIIFYSIYLILDSILFKNLHKSNLNMQKF